MKLRSFQCFCTAFCLLMLPSFAAEDREQQAALELAKMLNTDVADDAAVRNAIIKEMEGVIVKANINKEEADLLRKATIETAQKITKERLIDIAAESFLEQFTKEEIDAFLAFYQSPAGQVFLKKKSDLRKLQKQKLDKLAAQSSTDVMNRFSKLKAEKK